MSHQSPPDKTVVTPEGSWSVREVGKTGIQFGGVLFWNDALGPLVGLQFSVRPIGVQNLQVCIRDNATEVEYLYATAQDFVDPEAVDAFLSLRNLIPRPPYKPFFSTTKVISEEAPRERR